MPERLLTSREVAELLRVHDNTLRTWRQEGQGPPAVLIGRHWRYPNGALSTWLDGRWPVLDPRHTP